MFFQTTWSSPIYQQTVLIVLSLLFISGVIVYFLRKKNYYFISSWASLKSWLVFAPMLFVLLGMDEPWPLIWLTIFAITGAKIFFQLMGMFHRSYFVLTCYLGIVLLALCIHKNRMEFYNLMPMVVLGISCLVPLIRNNYKQMIQYISLTNLGFVFLGWSFMHLGLILKLESGAYQLMYLIILTEFCDNTNLAISKSIGRITMFDRIDTKRTLGGLIISAFLTIALAFAMRHLLPNRSEFYWLTSGIIASLGGFIGDMVMTVLRKDAGIKVVGAFIIGRGDLLNRMDRLIFVGPLYYYVMTLLPRFHL